ncbi:MAG TPA: hypothetical protein VMO20_03850 [Candidatus Acidoferrum sp.]|nr:hypothetical protein [Candidatus Acidoferrum sp.]
MKERQVKPQAVAENERVCKNRRALIAEIFQEGEQNDVYRGKVFTVFTVLINNNLSVHTSPYIFCRLFTSLAANGLSVYINVNVVLALPK